MAIFNTFQNRHIYVMKSDSSYQASALDKVGDIGIVKTSEGIFGPEICFQYKGADGALRSDLIQVKNISYAKAIAASDLEKPLNKVEVTLDENVNSGAPVAGQDYVLRIELPEFYGLSPEHVYVKDIAVRATAADDTAKKLFDKMVVALNQAFAREVGATASANPYLSFTASAATSASGTQGQAGYVAAQPAKLVIEEKEQPWTLGIGKVERVNFNVYPTTVYVGGDDVVWGVATNVTASNTNTIKDGKFIADLEWFCMGERGDQYRMMGYPNYIATEYLVDPSLEYHVLEIHHAFVDNGVNSYRSEKDITIVCPTSKKSALNSFIGALNSATGLSIATLS